MLGRDKAGSGLSLEKQEGALSKGFGQDRVSPEPPDSPGADEVSLCYPGGQGHAR